MGRTALRTLWVSLWCLIVTAVAAVACQVPADYRTNIRPNEGQGPTVINAAMGVADFLGVDDVNQQLDIDLVAEFSWRDARLVGLEGCRFGVTEVWFPPVVLYNSSNLRAARTQARNQVAIEANGLVTYFQRFTGSISSYHNLREFPFDRQFFELEFGSIEHGYEDLIFEPAPERTWISDRLNVEGWKIEGVALTQDQAALEEVDIVVSVLTLTVEAKRSQDFYVYRVILLLLFVVGMSWAIFWVPPTRFEFQIGLGATSMLTAIAFNLALSAQLPQLGYLTIMDKMLIWAILLIFLSIVEALWAGLLVLRDREEDALRLDRISRFIFPALLVGGWLIFIFNGIG